jgi:phosphatidylinositol-3,4,5-trisphosphate 5-phosphatase 2
VFDITNQFHHIFWFGDMNYRLNLPVESILPHIAAKNYGPLRRADQLRQQRVIGNVFFDFGSARMKNLPLNPTF